MFCKISLKKILMHSFLKKHTDCEHTGTCGENICAPTFKQRTLLPHKHHCSYTAENLAVRTVELELTALLH